jgi:hypothetical protein
MAKTDTPSDNHAFWRNVIIGVAVKIVVVGAAIVFAVSYYL